MSHTHSQNASLATNSPLMYLVVFLQVCFYSFARPVSMREARNYRRDVGLQPGMSHGYCFIVLVGVTVLSDFTLPKPRVYSIDYRL
ncbi:uncharacterized protein F4817DRAFT_333119 [Daldinia loculata]|uniref:uncharacterized protein n=1 Tax=Daldinia loculata TaxID=103429 RepID=UPI0020C3D73D|nr:uncharacterized protein F4817DRAFT_333119 [Daldinia loculata]KAI1648841.1 hypothetical protein F4817DRAFT_333119 [Daldinia loculata]